MEWSKLKEEKKTALQTLNAVQELVDCVSPQSKAPITYTQQQIDEWYRRQIHWNEAKKVKRQIAFEQKCEAAITYTTPRNAQAAVAFQTRLETPQSPRLRCNACLLKSCDDKLHVKPVEELQPAERKEIINDVSNIIARRNRSAVILLLCSDTMK